MIQLDKTDQLMSSINQMLNTLFVPAKAKRPFPATTADNEQLSDIDRKLAARYMRVNHVGEVCAQALYQSQSLTARQPEIREKLQHAASEEVDHLAWCQQRINELSGRPSLLNPVWYAGAFTIGAVAGIAGDKWNLGFLAETENQVAAHLEGHLSQLPEHDVRSKEVVAQMKLDEQQHAEQAIDAGAATLPPAVKYAMKIASKVMTRSAYWI